VRWRWLTRLTTLTVTAIVVGVIVLGVRASLPGTTSTGSFRTYAKFRDGSRLAIGSPVVIAGVQVGVIEDMTIEGRFARIEMRLQDGLDLPVDSFATRRADSLFGDSYVEIIPSSGDSGADTTPRLKSGDPIAHVVEGSSSDTILRGIAGAMPKIDNALDIVHDRVIGGRQWVGGPVLESLERADEWLGEGHIEGPMESASRSVTRIDELTARGATALANAEPEVTQTFDRIDEVIATSRARMRDARSGLTQAMRDTREGLDRLDPQIADARELFAAIDEGRGDDWQGTLGRAINDTELGDQLEDITSSGREAAGGFNRFRSWLGMRMEFDVFSRAARMYATAELRARNDKFYVAEFERGPLGGVPGDELSDAAGTSAYLRRQEIRDKIRFTAQFGKQLGMFAVRGGLKDSTFGVGADALLLEGRLKLSADVYGAFQRTPRVKLAGALSVFRSIYVLAGIDDALNDPGYLPIVSGNPGAPKVFEKIRHGRDYFVGGMLMVTDEDIAVLLRVYGALLVGSIL
jgi:phospholipid/cholesterol/gamma-HCH transport system substrate-binding protein